MRESHFKIMKQLKNMQNGVVDEGKLFYLIENMDINAKEYYGEL